MCTPFLIIPNTNFYHYLRKTGEEYLVLKFKEELLIKVKAFTVPLTIRKNFPNEPYTQISCNETS